MRYKLWLTMVVTVMSVLQISRIRGQKDDKANTAPTGRTSRVILSGRSVLRGPFHKELFVSYIFHIQLMGLLQCLQPEDMSSVGVLVWDMKHYLADIVLKVTLRTNRAVVITNGIPPPTVRDARHLRTSLYLVVLPDISESKSFCDELAKMSFRDPLAVYILVYPTLVTTIRLFIEELVAYDCTTVNIKKQTPLAARFIIFSVIDYSLTYHPQFHVTSLAEKYLVWLKKVELTELYANKALLPSRQYYKNKLRRGRRYVFSSYSGQIMKYLYVQEKGTSKRLLLLGPEMRILTEIVMKHMVIRHLYKMLPFEHGERINKTYSGALGAIQRHEVIIHMSTLRMQPELSEIGDWLMPITYNTLYLFVKKGERIPFSLMLLKPYTMGAWQCLLVTLVAAALAWHVVRPPSSYSGNASHNRHPQRLGRSLFDVIAMFMQGDSVQVHLHSQRIVIFLVLIFSVIVLNCYSNQLLTFLLVPSYFPDINTLSEAAEKINIAHHFESSIVSGTPLLNKKIKQLDIVKTEVVETKRNGSKNNMFFIHANKTQMDIAIEVVETIKLDGKDAIVLHNFNAPFYMMKGKAIENGVQKIHQVAEPFLEASPAAFLMRKGDPTFDIFNHLMLVINEAGFYAYYVGILTNQMQCDGWEKNPSQDPEPKPLTLEQVTGPCLLLGMGLALATLAFAAETLCYFRFHRRPPPTPRAKRPKKLVFNHHKHLHIPYKFRP